MVRRIRPDRVVALAREEVPGPGDDVPDVAAAVQDATEACAIAVYRRESPSAYRPSLR